MKSLNALWLLPFFLVPLYSTLDELLDNINEALIDIETDKEIYYQHIGYDRDLPFNIEYTLTTEKVKDGKQETESFLLNMALLDKNKVEIKSSKDKMAIRLETPGKYIQEFKNGEAKGMTNNLEILARDIDAAREIKALIDESIPMAVELWESSIDVPEALPDLKNWLISYIKDISSDKKSWNQSLSLHDTWMDYMVFDILEEGKDYPDKYTFSLADVDAGALKVNPSGDMVKLEVKTRDGKRYMTRDEDQDRKFENSMEVFFNDAGTALEFTKGLKNAIPMAGREADARINAYQECSSCLEDLGAAVSSYKGADWTTTLNEDCDAELIYTKKDKGEKVIFTFNWSDLNTSTIEQDYNSGELKLTVQTTGKEKFITRSEDGEIKGYEEKVELLFDDLEVFRKMKFRLEKAIEGCESGLKPESIDWMDDLLKAGPINKMNQSLQVEAGETCALVFTTSEAEKDKSYIYEFNLYDLDERKVELKIRGTNLGLELFTRKNEKIITKTNQDGKLEYTNKLTIDMDNIENLRIAKMTFEKLIKGCQR